MKASLLEIVFFLGVIALNLLYYKQIQAFFRKIYTFFEKRVENKYGLICPIATRHWPYGFDYMVLERRQNSYRCYFYDKEPELWIDTEDGSSHWFSQCPYQVQAGKDIPFGPVTKEYEFFGQEALKWKR